jgi:2-polyprenyl-3-methyl-5-hydroxy-6-metoxy-1,4-benzoquinol methylase
MEFMPTTRTINIDPSSGSAISAILAHLFPDGPILQRHIQRLRPYICPYEELIPFVHDGETVLDVGCGAGLLLGLLGITRPGIEGVGFDTSERAIALATRVSMRVSEYEPTSRVRFECLDKSSPWPEGVFDVVSVVDVLHHIPPSVQSRFLGSLLAKVKPGGILLYKDMVRKPLWRAAANALHDLVMAGERIHYFPIERVEEAAARAGFRLEASRDINRLWYGHELRVFRSPI